MSFSCVSLYEISNHDSTYQGAFGKLSGAFPLQSSASGEKVTYWLERESDDTDSLRMSEPPDNCYGQMPASFASILSESDDEKQWIIKFARSVRSKQSGIAGRPANRITMSQSS